jgi:hypothetical protein
VCFDYDSGTQGDGNYLAAASLQLAGDRPLQDLGGPAPTALPLPSRPRYCHGDTQGANQYENWFGNVMMPARMHPLEFR